MSQFWRCTAKPEEHGVLARDRLVTRTTGQGGRDLVAAERYACPTCVAEGAPGWVEPANVSRFRFSAPRGGDA